jgi:hypothetical protein
VSFNSRHSEVTMSELLKLNVNEHVEKKNGLSYLSWAWAWAEVLKHDPLADWEHIEYPQPDGTISPCIYCGGGTALVKTKVTIKGKTRTCMLPVMNNRNQAIKDPDAFAINTAIVRCMTKNVSMFGLGLYIYAGEDLPESDEAADLKLEPEQKDYRANPAALVAESVADHISAQRKDDLTEDAFKIVTAFKSLRTDDLMAIVDSISDNDEKAYLWHLLAKESKVRAFIKAQAAERRAVAA